MLDVDVTEGGGRALLRSGNLSCRGQVTMESFLQLVTKRAMLEDETAEYVQTSFGACQVS